MSSKSSFIVETISLNKNDVRLILPNNDEIMDVPNVVMKVHRSNFASLQFSISMQLQATGDFSDYLNENKTVNTDKLCADLFYNRVKLVYYED